MNEPDDFGYGPVACLAHVCDGRRSSIHAPFWRAWDEAVLGHRPTLAERRTADPADATATHEFESSRHVPIGCRLLEPEPGTPIRAGLLVLHGYEHVRPLADDAARYAWAPEKGLLTLLIRVRGYPGSMAETGNLAASARGYVSHGLDVPIDRPGEGCAWVLSGAVADVANAWRVLLDELARRRAGDAPIYAHAESFGAALAIIAGARLERRGCGHEPLRRLALGTPTLGNWTWRIAHPTRHGAGAQALAVIRDLRGQGEKIYRTLRLFDAAVHARYVRGAVLCKLALRDEVVPAPAAAAVFNALRAPTGLARRFVTPYGHFEGGIANARRHAEFARAVEVFLDPSVDEATALRRVDPYLLGGSRPTQQRLFESTRSDDDAALARAYEQEARTLDDLPYTPEFERLFEAVGGDYEGRSRREVFHRLHNLRKAGRLARLGRGASQPPKISADEEAHLRSLVQFYAGSLGQRDRLPYTPEFDRLVERFNDSASRNLEPHDVWRLIAKLAK